MMIRVISKNKKTPNKKDITKINNLPKKYALISIGILSEIKKYNLFG